jgi:hypothetical protein
MSKKEKSAALNLASTLSTMYSFGSEQKPLLNNVRRVMLGLIADLPSKYVTPFGELTVTDAMLAEAQAMAAGVDILPADKLTGLAKMAKVKVGKVSPLAKDERFLAANLLFFKGWLDNKGNGGSKAEGGDSPTEFDWD